MIPNYDPDAYVKPAVQQRDMAAVLTTAVLVAELNHRVNRLMLTPSAVAGIERQLGFTLPAHVRLDEAGIVLPQAPLSVRTDALTKMLTEARRQRDAQVAVTESLRAALVDIAKSAYGPTSQLVRGVDFYDGTQGVRIPGPLARGELTPVDALIDKVNGLRVAAATNAEAAAAWASRAEAIEQHDAERRTRGRELWRWAERTARAARQQVFDAAQEAAVSQVLAVLHESGLLSDEMVSILTTWYGGGCSRISRGRLPARIKRIGDSDPHVAALLKTQMFRSR